MDPATLFMEEERGMMTWKAFFGMHMPINVEVHINSGIIGLCINSQS
jgi:hypothetical protein